MKLNELTTRMSEYYAIDENIADIIPIGDNVDDTIQYNDAGIAGRPEIKIPDNYIDDVESFDDLEESIIFSEDVEILFYNEDFNILDEKGNMFFEDEDNYYFFEADKDKDGIDDKEDDYDSEEDVYPDEDNMTESLLEYILVTKIKHGEKIRVLPPKKGFKRIGGKYQKMSAFEQKIKSKIAKKGWKKKKPHLAVINKNRAKSMKRRKSV